MVWKSGSVPFGYLQSLKIYNKAIKMAGLLFKCMVCFVLFLFLCVEGMLFADPHILLCGPPSLCVA